MCRDDRRFDRGHRWGPDGFGPPDEVHHRHERERWPEPEPPRDFGPPPPPAGPFGFRRHFISDAEVIDMLREYLAELEKEAQGVREAIEELEAEMEDETADGE